MRGAGGILCEPVARVVEDGSLAGSALGLVRILAEAALRVAGRGSPAGGCRRRDDRGDGPAQSSV
jgi:hypothetical protein